MRYLLSEETFGYTTSPDSSNTDIRYLVAGSMNVLIDFQRKVRTRSGYTRLGVGNTTLTPIRNAWTWDTSNAISRPQRFYDDELEVYLGTIDTVAVNAWTRVKDGWSTTKKLRSATWWDATENIDLQIMVIGDANIYEWSGGIAIVDSVTTVTITKKGTTTFAQNRFYTTRNKTLVCVRTGTEYTYTGGETTTTLTGIADTTGLQAGDILMQKIVTNSNAPASNRTNDLIFGFENQICVGSYSDESIFISRNTAYATFTFSSPRNSGEGAKLTLDDPTRAINSLGKNLLVFSGRSGIFKAQYTEIPIGSTIAETLNIKKLDTGIDQGALNQESVIPIGNALAYLSNEVALRIIESPDDLTGINPKTFSNPIKPDFDAETWTDAFLRWYKNILFISAPATSHVYMLNFTENADGELNRFWNPPQMLPVGPMSVIDSGNGPLLHGHSNAVPESYLLFDGASDSQYADMETEDKLPIHCKAVYAYNDEGDRGDLKNFDEYYVEGEITPATDTTLNLNYDFAGSTQYIQKTIEGDDESILEGSLDYNSLGQNPLGQNPLGGLLNPPSDARKFRVVFEIAREDFFQIQAIFESYDVDKYWAITSHGSNATISRRRAINKRK